MQVPYRHWKRFEGDFIVDGKRVRRTCFMYARTPGIDTRVNADSIGEEFAQAGHVLTHDVGFCRLRAFSLRDFADYVEPRLRANPRLFLVNQENPAKPASPIKRIDHIGIVSRYAKKIRSFMELIPCPIANEATVSTLDVKCEYFSGLNTLLELVEPTSDNSAVLRHFQKNASTPLHHIAFEVESLDDAAAYFAARGYPALDGRIHLGPRPFERVMFLSPVATGGLLAELVAFDGRKDPVYTGGTDV